MKTKKMNTRKIINSIIAFFFLLFLYYVAAGLTGVRSELLHIARYVITTPFFNKCAPIERKLKRHVAQEDTIYVVHLNSLTRFEWTDFYVISGPRFPQEVEEITGISCYGTKIVHDRTRQLIFVNNDKIVKDHRSTCARFFWDRHPRFAGKGFSRFSYSSVIHIKKERKENKIWHETSLPPS